MKRLRSLQKRKSLLPESPRRPRSPSSFCSSSNSSFSDFSDELPILTPLDGNASPAAGVTVQKSAEFSNEELSVALNDLSVDNVIGEDDFGALYCGELRREAALPFKEAGKNGEKENEDKAFDIPANNAHIERWRAAASFKQAGENGEKEIPVGSIC